MSLSFSQRKRETAASPAKRALPLCISQDKPKHDGEVIMLNGISGYLSMVNGEYEEQEQLYLTRPTFKSLYVPPAAHLLLPDPRQALDLPTRH